MADEMGGVITLQNFATAMPRFDPDNTTTNDLYGLVDMGSNGIRFSISDLSPPRSRLLPCVYRERVGISLYDSLHESMPDSKPFYFSKHTIKEVAETLGRFKDICDGHNVQKSHISVFATEAMRTAKNKDEMLRAIREESGLNVDIMDPKMESMFGAMGARSGFTHVNGLFMDLGGGSVQMTYVNSEHHEQYNVLAAEAAISMPFGAAKLTLALSSQDTAEAATKDLKSGMKESLEGLAERFPPLKDQMRSKEGITIYFCGGGFRGYGSMLMHTEPIQPYPIPAIGGYTVPGNRFINWRAMLHANSFEKGKVYGMSKRRREQFPAIVTVVQALVEAIPKYAKINKVIFCSGGNREGVLYMKLPPQVRESSPIPLLPPSSSKQPEDVLDSITSLLTSAIPSGCKTPCSNELLHYIARNIWTDMGHGSDTNSAKGLHDPISGSLSSLPGLTHEDRAILSLALSSRWGSDLAPHDKAFREYLHQLIGAEQSWWCDYIGIVASFLASIIPAFPSSATALQEAVTFKASSSHGLGKKGHKVGIRLEICLSGKAKKGLHIGDLENMFSKVGKGLQLGWKVEAEIVS